MASRRLIRDAAIALNRAISATQAAQPIEASTREAQNWLEAARLTSTSEEEKDEIHLWECYAFCLTNDYGSAYEKFQTANAGREAPRSWQAIGVIIYAKMNLPADFAEGLRQYDTALNWVIIKERNLDINPVKAILYGRKAFYHLKMTRYADAMACCEIASELLPEHLAPLRIIAEIKLNRGEYEKAITYLSKAIALRIEGPHFWDFANRGSAFLETGNLQEAFHDMKIALELEPQSPVVLSNLGIAFEKTGNLTEAGRCYSLALSRDYHSLPAHNNRGTLLFSRQDYQQAERAFSIAVQLEPDNSTLWFNRGLARFEMQMYGESLSDMSVSSRLGNQAWEANYISGMCRARLNEYSTAIAILGDLVLTSNLDREDNSLIWNNIGVMEHRMNRLEAAHRCFIQSATENPLNEQAQANIDRIKSTMSGTTLLATEESQLGIAPRSPTSYPLSLSQSDIINTVSIASSMAAMASQYLG